MFCCGKVHPGKVGFLLCYLGVPIDENEIFSCSHLILPSWNETIDYDRK